jgi:hypothetical protein
LTYETVSLTQIFNFVYYERWIFAIVFKVFEEADAETVNANSQRMNGVGRRRRGLLTFWRFWRFSECGLLANERMEIVLDLCPSKYFYLAVEVFLHSQMHPISRK